MTHVGWICKLHDYIGWNKQHPHYDPDRCVMLKVFANVESRREARRAVNLPGYRERLV